MVEKMGLLLNWFITKGEEGNIYQQCLVSFVCVLPLIAQTSKHFILPPWNKLNHFSYGIVGLNYYKAIGKVGRPTLLSHACTYTTKIVGSHTYNSQV